MDSDCPKIPLLVVDVIVADTSGCQREDRRTSQSCRDPCIWILMRPTWVYMNLSPLVRAFSEVSLRRAGESSFSFVRSFSWEYLALSKNVSANFARTFEQYLRTVGENFCERAQEFSKQSKRLILELVSGSYSWRIISIVIDHFHCSTTLRLQR